jgi:uncharacterized repeat protein (TIGR01451 family)
MQVRTLLAAIVAVGAVLAAASPASAHPSPAGCNTNGIDLAIDKNLQVVRPGDVITYGIHVQNTKGLPCDITGATLNFYEPTATGAATTTPFTVSSNAGFNAGFPLTKIADRAWTVAVNRGVESVIAQAGVKGILHDIPGDTSFAEIIKTLGTQVTQPEIKIDKIGSIQAGQAPQNVTYTYLVTNTSSTPVPLNKVVVSDNLCAGPTYVGGDNGDNLLSNGETWTYTCSMLHQNPGVYTNTAKACAYSTVPGDTTREVCSPPDTWTVTLTPAPQVAVKPVAVSQSPCTLSRTNSTTVRAKQLNTIRVRVRNVDAGTTVKVTLPGGKTVSAKTNKDGIATLRVRPTKSGTAKIEAAECSDVERLSVKPARRVVAQRAPRVTG